MVGRYDKQTAGRSGLPYKRQRLSRVSWIHLAPADFPSGIPGIGEETDGAMQHAPQSARQSIFTFLRSGGLVMREGRFTASNERSTKHPFSLRPPAFLPPVASKDRAAHLPHRKAFGNRSFDEGLDQSLIFRFDLDEFNSHPGGF